MAGVPGAARRLWRDRPRLLALGLLGATVVAASGLQTTAAIVLQQTLDENWRGTYDILVTQRDKDPVRSGFLHSEALVDALSGRLSMDDLKLIRSLPGVEVAAPIGEATFADSPLPVWLPVPVRAAADVEHPQAFRITVTSSTDDGTGARDLAPQSLLTFAYRPSFTGLLTDAFGRAIIGADGRPVFVDNSLAAGPQLISADNSQPFASGSYDAVSGTIPLGVLVSPRPAGTIELVDPVAERQLLGDAGAFLDPLIDAGLPSGSTTHPILVQRRADPALTMRVTVEEFDRVTPGLTGAAAIEASGGAPLENGQIAPVLDTSSGATLVGEYSIDLSTHLSPFVEQTVTVGEVSPSSAEAANRTLAGPIPRSALHGVYTVPDDAARTGRGIVLHARGYASHDQYAIAPLSAGAPLGSVTDYAKLYGSLATDTAGESGPLSSHFRIVGEFAPHDIKSLAGEVNFMPLGGYDIESPSVVTSPGTASVPLATSLTGFGVPGTNELAVGSFDILEPWGVERPITAIRIRVAGIDAYTPDAQQRLLEAANALTRLGFTATVVAGSSPQSLPVLVSGFATAQEDDSGKQVIADLGYIQQDWSRLGAVIEAQTGVSATSVALLVVSMVSVGVLLAVVQLGAIPVRQAQSNVFRELGWRRRRIRRWFAAEEAIGLTGVALIGAVAAWLSAVTGIASIAVGLAVALVVATSVIAVVSGSRAKRHTVRRATPRPAGRAPGIGGPISFGARQARAYLVHSVSLGLAVLFITVSIAIGATVFVQGRELAGPSLLGAVASARAWLPQGILAAVSLASGVALAVLSRRMSEARRREQWAAIRAMGWHGRAVIRAHVAELAFSAVPGLLAGLAVAAAITATAVPALLAPVVTASAFGGVVAVAVVLVSGRRVN